MGGVRSFRIESKRFDLIREGDGVDAVSLLEIGRYMRHLVTMGKEGALWLGKCIEENIVRETEQAFVCTFREQDKGYVIRRFENKRGRYLEIADYGRGGCKGRLAIPEGQKQSEWRGFNKELTLLFNLIPVVKGYTSLEEENTKKRILSKERLGPAVSYADSLRILATEKLTEKGKTVPALIPNLKSLKPTDFTLPNDKVSEKKEGKAKP